MIKVSNEVTVYEVDGVEQKQLDMPVIKVRSHWNQNTLVVIEAAGKRLTVAAKDLEAAIANARNTARFGL